MDDFYIRISNLHWRGEEKEYIQDICLHGSAEIKIGSHIIDNGMDTEWTVSAGVLRMLRSLFNNHIMGDDEHMMPCCGHFVIPNKKMDAVDIVGCCYGLDWTVLHYGNIIKLITDNDTIINVPYNDYKNVVLKIADQVESVYLSSLPKVFNNDNCDFNEKEYKAFWCEWHHLKENAIHYKPEDDVKDKIDYSDYKTYDLKCIKKISKSGIIYRPDKANEFIDFEDCAQYYGREKGIENCRYVGEKYITASTICYDFHTAPKITSFCLLPENKIKKIFFRKKVVDYNYLDFDNQIGINGWQIFDIT